MKRDDSKSGVVSPLQQVHRDTEQIKESPHSHQMKRQHMRTSKIPGDQSWTSRFSKASKNQENQEYSTSAAIQAEFKKRSIKRFA